MNLDINSLEKDVNAKVSALAQLMKNVDKLAELLIICYPGKKYINIRFTSGDTEVVFEKRLGYEYNFFFGDTKARNYHLRKSKKPYEDLIVFSKIVNSGFWEEVLINKLNEDISELKTTNEKLEKIV